MAKSSTTNPYRMQTERIALVGNYSNRLASSAKDQIFYNVLPESVTNTITQTKKVWLNKRGGFASHLTVDAGGGAGRGIFYWPEANKTYSVIDDQLYADSTSIKTLATSTGKVWFSEFKGTSHLLILGDGTDLYTIATDNTVTEITDTDLVTSPVTPVFFDSYVFVIKSGTPEIYNSDVDDPTAWDPTNFLSAEQYSDDLIALTRQVNYVVGFGHYSVEFFYDAANASGSPLARQESVSIKVGLAARDTVAQIDKRIFWVGQTQTGEPSVWQIEGLSAKEVSNEFVRKLLTNEGASLADAKAYIVSHKGHVLYVLNLSTRTLVLDCEEGIWVEWSINDGSDGHAVLPFNYATEGENNTILVLHNTNGKIYKLDPTVHTDDDSIVVEIVTDRVDFNTNNWKKLCGFTLIADKESAGTVTLTWSDDDYQTWSNARTLDLTAHRPYTKAGGVFRRRSFKLKHTENAPFRAETMELDYQPRTN